MELLTLAAWDGSSCSASCADSKQCRLKRLLSFWAGRQHLGEHAVLAIVLQLRRIIVHNLCDDIFQWLLLMRRLRHIQQ